MNNCSKHRKRLALRAAGVLEGAEWIALRSHLASCAACRRHLDELSDISRQHSNLVDSLPAPDLSSDWHNRLIQRMRAPQLESRNALHLRLWVAFGIFRRQLAIPFAVAAGVAFLLLIRPSPDSGSGSLTSQPNPSLTVMNNSANFTPTLLSYQRALRESPETLDALLNQEAGVSSQSSLRITAASWNSALLTE